MTLRLSEIDRALFDDSDYDDYTGSEEEDNMLSYSGTDEYEPSSNIDSSDDDYYESYQSKKKKKLRDFSRVANANQSQPTPVSTDLLSLPSTSTSQRFYPLSGPPRARKIIYINQNRFRDPIERPPCYNNERCDLCDVVFQNQEEVAQHIIEESHVIRNTYSTNRKEMTKTIDGLKLSLDGFCDDELGRLNITLRDNKFHKYDLLLLNESGSPIHVNKFFKICKLENVDIPQAERELQLELPPNGQIEIGMSINFQGLGAYLVPLVFKMKGKNEGDSFKYLLKEVIFRSQTELMDMLAPLTPYKPLLPNIVQEMEEPIISYTPRSGDKPSRRGLAKLKTKEYHIPQRLKYLMMKVETSKKENLPVDDLNEWNATLAILKSPLTEQNYAKKFALLLHLEELQQEYELLKFGQNGEILEKQRNGLYELEVPGLAEKRPSVLRGDSVFVRIQNHYDFRYEGFVKEVRQETVLLDFNNKFKNKYTTGMRVDVRFKLNRLPIIYSHRTVEMLAQCEAKSIMFPSADDTYPEMSRPLQPWKFKKMENNLEQQQAVRQIVNKTAMPAPYLVFGPPGTGKTVTIVEAIVQVWFLNKGNPEKQLVCAPTNSTADLLTVNLLKLIPSAKIFRVYAMSFDEIQMNQDIPKKYTNIANKYIVNDARQLESYDILIMTLVTAGRLVSAGLKSGHFQYVYVDECGQALEPEALIPVAGILTNKNIKGHVSGQLVLAGDPKQLGPVLQSTKAKQSGLELSLLERLMETNELYKKDPVEKKYNSKYLTKLVQNFRSHDQILTVSNQMFYDNDLQAKGDKMVIERAIGWTQLPNPNLPLIFHGVEGIDERECSSPSYFNRQEIDQVISYMKTLLADGLKGKTVKQEDIGVITPYRKQVQKFNRAFRVLNWTRVKVGTTEQFQGDERLVIIISTVRSSSELLDHDHRYRLGFLKNPKRFNVAVTRAKALLIMVGNPKILCHDFHWCGFMKFVRENDGAIGTGWCNPQHLQSALAKYCTF